MTIDEASAQYQIPISILKEYEQWGLCHAATSGMGAWQYDSQDIERLSMIMTLYDLGFSNTEVERYMRFLISPNDTKRERLEMLQSLRNKEMDELHIKQKNVDHLDYLKRQIQENQE